MEDKIQIILQAVEQAKTQIDDAISQINKLNDANSKSEQQHKKNKDAVHDQAAELIKYTLEVAALTEGLKLLVEASIEVPEQMERMAQAAGTTIERFSTLAGAAERYHVDNQLLSVSLKNLAVATSDALRGDANRIAQFKELGISTEFLKANQNNLVAILEKVSNAFQNHADGVNKTKLAQDLFGRSAREMINFLNQGSVGIEAMSERVKELGGAIDETAAKQSHDYTVAVKDFQTVVGGQVRTIVQGLLPAFTDLIKDVLTLVNAFPKLTQVIAGSTVVFLAAQTAMGPYAVILGGIVLTITAGVEAWHAFKAAQDEALTKNNLVSQQERIKTALDKQVNAFQNAGKLTELEAQRMRKALSDAFLGGNDAQFSQAQKLVTNRLRDLKGLGEIKPAAAGEDGKPQFNPVADPALIKAKADAALSIQKSLIDKATAQNKAALDVQQRDADLAFKERTISAEEWASKSQAISNKRVADEKAAAYLLYKDQTDLINKTLKETSDPKEIAKLRADRLVIETDYHRKLIEISQQGADRRFAIEQGFEEKTRTLMLGRIQEVARQQTEAQNQYKTKLDEISTDEQAGLISVTEAQKEKLTVEDDYLSKLKGEQAQFQTILDLMVEINKVKAGTFKPEDIAGIQAAISGNQKRQAEVQKEILGDKQQGSFSAQFNKVLNDTQKSWGSWAKQSAQTFASVWDTAINSISKGISGLIQGTMTWGQALREIGTSILDAVIQGIVKMFVTWILNMLILRGLQRLFGIEANTQASESAAAWMPAAVAASIASYGAAATVGTAAAIAGVAIGTAFASGISAGGGASGGFAEGGLVPGAISRKDNMLAMVASGEYIFDSDSVQKFGSENFQRLHKAIQNGGVSFNATGGAATAPRSRAFASGGPVGPSREMSQAGAGVTVKAAFINTRNQFRQFQRDEGAGIVIDAMADRGNQVVA